VTPKPLREYEKDDRFFSIERPKWSKRRDLDDFTEDDEAMLEAMIARYEANRAKLKRS